MELKEIIERLEEQAELLRTPQEKALMEAARMLKESNGNVWYDAEKLPPMKFSICIIRLAGNEFAESCMAMLTDDDWRYWPDRMGEKVDGKVTHWMPRPKAPK